MISSVAEEPHRGPPLTADVTVARISSRDPRWSEVAWLLHDVTERRKDESELRQAHDELERRVQEKNRTADLETSQPRATKPPRRLVEIQGTGQRSCHRHASCTTRRKYPHRLDPRFGVISARLISPTRIAARGVNRSALSDGTMEGLPADAAVAPHQPRSGWTGGAALPGNASL